MNINTKETVCGNCIYLSQYSKICTITTRRRGNHHICICGKFKSAIVNVKLDKI